MWAAEPLQILCTVTFQHQQCECRPFSFKGSFSNFNLESSWHFLSLAAAMHSLRLLQFSLGGYTFVEYCGGYTSFSVLDVKLMWVGLAELMQITCRTFVGCISHAVDCRAASCASDLRCCRGCICCLPSDDVGKNTGP